MCGIIGYVGKDENSLEALLEGLSALEYRGYDSAGIAAFDCAGRLRTVKDVGRVSGIKEAALEIGASACGIGHTRWATHGAPSKENSHPHGTDRLQLVHNGIIENYAHLKKELTELGYSFYSDTDTEVAAKLLDYYYMRSGRRFEAVCETIKRLTGSYALGIVFSDDPDTIYAARKDSPLIIGIGDGEAYIASDVTAFLRRTRDYYRLEDGDVAKISARSIEIYNGGKKVTREKLTAKWDHESAEKGGYDHFMLKEIHEESEAVVKTLRPRIKDMLPDFSDDELNESMLKHITRLYIVACGTAMHAGLIGRAVFEGHAKLPVSVEIASEFRYNDPILSENDLVVVVSQSGETADSLAALRLAKQKGAQTLAIVNVIGSSIAKEAHSVLYTWAGPEIAVASTKAYSVQAALLTLLAIRCAILRGEMNELSAREFVRELYEDAPRAINEVLERVDHIKACAERLYKSEDMFFIGRGTDYALSCEGSLKLKEISYIHSEAYAAGELKHGTISLITEGIPVVALATVSSLHAKMLSNIREVRSRGAVLTLITNGESEEADMVIRLPEISERVSFLPTATVLQLLAYYTSVFRGCDIDKPRNLAKSVTVE
ncbi:MAG: glutamine--fructose-6-phosphate transaminase (isomerizing) [Clostridia bacterium]|nr:glutamine--fructose-6-phosphate transaminase (isomerizing) [Clostridia bacterium]